MNPILSNVILVGSIGCLIFSCLIVLIALSGAFSEVRDDNGKFKKLTWKGALAFGFFLTFMFGLFYTGSIRLVGLDSSFGSFQILWMNAFGIFFVIHLYDLIILDYLVVVKWHPAWAKMPDTPYFTAFRPHLIGFVRGIPFGMLCSLITALIFPYLST